MRTFVVAIAFALAAIGGTYWFMARYAQISRTSGGSAAVCTAHGLPPAGCPFCEPSLVKKLGRCREHGVPEALCWKCRPALVAAFKIQNDWCAEHERPESLCTLCGHGAEFMDTDKEAADHAEHDHAGHNYGPGDKHALDDAPARPAPLPGDPPPAVREEPRLQRAPSAACTTEEQQIELSPELAARVGLSFATIDHRKLSESIACNAQIAYDGNRYARLASRVPGVVHEVLVDLGARVTAGQPLAVVDSPELAAAKTAYLQAAASAALADRNLVQERGMLDRQVGTVRSVLAAETTLAERRLAEAGAARRLRALGLTDAQIEGVTRDEDAGSSLQVVAPFDGVVVERDAVVGEACDAARPLFALADTRRMWALLDMTAADAARVQVGQSVALRVDGLDDETFRGKITWIASALDPRSRMLRARAEIDNAEGTLRANLFARAWVRVHEDESRPVAPRAAVQWDGCCNVVFVRQGDSSFKPRKVRLGFADADVVEVRSGLEGGEVVVTQGSYLLKTELLKGSIGAGCCEVGHLDK